MQSYRTTGVIFLRNESFGNADFILTLRDIIMAVIDGVDFHNI